ncbi:MAG: hypothetical protein KatS3mg102_1448 [Planctomycetota bacterium]|nr:MAG: hypothetical protein KatS3mg102_1448 [Planctomycetota bacterium]
MALTKAIARASRALIYLSVAREGEPGEHAGVATVVSAAGHALTAGHLLRAARAVCGRAIGEREDRPARILELDLEHDLALVQLERARPWTPMRIWRGPPLPLGTEVAFMGLPYADIFRPPLVMTMRAIIGNRYRLGGVTYEVLDAAAAEGMSGGPLFETERGELVGIVSGRFDPGRTRARLGGMPPEQIARLPAERASITFAVGSEDVRALLARHQLLPS